MWSFGRDYRDLIIAQFPDMPGRGNAGNAIANDHNVFHAE